MLGAEHVGLDRLDGGELDHVDVLHRRGVDHDVDVGHRVAQAGRIADVAGEEAAAVVIETLVRGGEARLIGIEQAEGADVGRQEVVGGSVPTEPVAPVMRTVASQSIHGIRLLLQPNHRLCFLARTQASGCWLHLIQLPCTGN